MGRQSANLAALHIGGQSAGHGRSGDPGESHNRLEALYSRIVADRTTVVRLR